MLVRVECLGLGGGGLTPSTVMGFEDLELDFSTKLNYAILAVFAAIAVSIAFVYVPPACQIVVAKASLVVSAHGIRKDFAAVFLCSIPKTKAVGVLASAISSILSSTITTYHEVFRCSNHAFTKDALIDKYEVDWWGGAIDSVVESDCGSPEGFEMTLEASTCFSLFMS